MVARVTVAEIDPVRQDPRHAIERFESDLIPALHEQEGYDVVVAEAPVTTG